MEVQVNTSPLLEPTRLSEKEGMRNGSCAAERIEPEASVSIPPTAEESSTIRPTGGAVLSCFRKYAVLWSAVGIVLIAVVCGGTGYALGYRSGKEDGKRLPAACCPDDWIKIQGKCFYFSKAEGNWTDSQNNCSSLSASLARFESPKVQDSLPFPGKLDHWIGLQRAANKSWKWIDGTNLDSRFEIQGEADCAALDEHVKVISSSCSSQRKWICSKLHNS